MKSGLTHIRPDTRDYSLLPTYGALGTGAEGLPESFSIYDGRTIPNQDQADTRFPFTIPPLPVGCTGESGAFESGIQDGALYNPQDLFLATPPGDAYAGRDIRQMLQTLISRGVKDANGNLSPKRLAYLNCYGSGKIDDFDAARIGIWINQAEKRGIYIGSRWAWGDTPPAAQLYVPQYSSSDPLHCYIATGWTPDGLEVIPWIGESVGNKGVFYLSRQIYNSLMAMPYTGAFTITKLPSSTPIPVGYQAVIDHLIYYIKERFSV